MKPTQRRICWPDPELNCLSGFCAYCNQGPFREMAEIEDQLVSEEQWEAWRRGKTANFGATQTRRGR